MADDSFQERTEPATGKKIKDARDRGSVARSQDVNAVAILIGAFVYLMFAGPGILDRLVALVRRCLGLANGGFVLDTNVMQALFVDMIMEITLIVMPFALTLAVIGVAANVSQFGLIFTLKPLSPSLNSLNPISGVKKLFGLKGIVDALKSVIKFVIVAAFLYTFIRGIGPELIGLIYCPVPAIPGKVGGLVLGIGWRIIAALVILAAADLFYQRYDYKKKLRMSKQEVKDERKQSEGDEKTRARIRAKQLQMTRNRMLAAVPKANVVITNPIHVAVALRYDPSTMPAPQVVAKGARLMAERIKSIARSHGVPVIERPPLARLLFKTVRAGHIIPEALYQVVAEILAHVYRTRAARMSPPIQRLNQQANRQANQPVSRTADPSPGEPPRPLAPTP